MTDSTQVSTTGSNGSDDFLMDIQAAEIKAAHLVATAEEKKLNTLSAYRQELKTAQAAKIKAARQEAEIFVQDKKSKAAMEIAAESQKAAKDAEKFYAKKEAMIKPLIPAAIDELIRLLKRVS